MCRVKGRGAAIRVEDVVILKDDSTNRLFWKLAVVHIPGRDGQVRAAVIIVCAVDEGKRATFLRRTIQHLYPIEVHSDLSQ